MILLMFRFSSQVTTQRRRPPGASIATATARRCSACLGGFMRNNTLRVSETGIITVALSCEEATQLPDLLDRKMILHDVRLTSQILGTPPTRHVLSCRRMQRDVLVETNGHTSQ